MKRIWFTVLVVINFSMWLNESISAKQYKTKGYWYVDAVGVGSSWTMDLPVEHHIIRGIITWGSFGIGIQMATCTFFNEISSTSPFLCYVYFIPYAQTYNDMSYSVLYGYVGGGLAFLEDWYWEEKGITYRLGVGFGLPLLDLRLSFIGARSHSKSINTFNCCVGVNLLGIWWAR